jgi:hypothetical protein
MSANSIDQLPSPLASDRGAALVSVIIARAGCVIPTRVSRASLEESRPKNGAVSNRVP